MFIVVAVGTAQAGTINYRLAIDDVIASNHLKTPWGFGLDTLPGLFYTAGLVPGLPGSACRPAALFRPRRGPLRQAIGTKPKATR